MGPAGRGRPQKKTNLKKHSRGAAEVGGESGQDEANRDIMDTYLMSPPFNREDGSPDDGGSRYKKRHRSG